MEYKPQSAVVDSSAPVTIGPSPSLVINPSAAIRIVPATKIQVGPSITVGPNPKTVIAPQIAVTIPPSKVRLIRIEPTRALRIDPPQRGAWEERGWTKSENRSQQVYEGPYQVMNKRDNRRLQFQGRIIANGQSVALYIADPPPEIKRHPHGSCFQLYRAPWFQLHWSRPARNVDDAILYMERVLDESINR